jgi:hypothetical protein
MSNEESQNFTRSALPYTLKSGFNVKAEKEGSCEKQLQPIIVIRTKEAIKRFLNLIPMCRSGIIMLTRVSKRPVMAFNLELKLNKLTLTPFSSYPYLMGLRIGITRRLVKRHPNKTNAQNNAS